MEKGKPMRLTRAFYTRNTLQVARELLGKVLVHQLPSGELVKGRIVETEAYAGRYDPGSHTYQDRRTERNEVWYGEGGFAYVYQIYGVHVCLGIITEAPQVPGAVLIRAVEPTEGLSLFVRKPGDRSKPERLGAGPSKLCVTMQIDKRCDGLDLCGQELYLEDVGERIALEQIIFGPRVNIDYAGHGALAAWRYCLRGSPAISKKAHEPLRDWLKGYPSHHAPRALDLLTHLTQREEETMMPEDDLRLIQSLPKTELHLHLEGMTRPATLRALCQKNRVPLPAHLEEAEEHTFGTFDEFAYTYHRICQAIASAQDFALLIADVAEYLNRNTLLYAEIAWTPFLYLNRGLRFAEIMDVLNEALIGYGIADRVNFLIDIQRDHGIEAGAWVYRQACAYAATPGSHLVGVGLVGQEQGFPPAQYQALFRQAREQGLGTTAHAGEYGTPEDIWQCVHDLGATRIGHGICAIQDRALVEYLVEQRIHLEVCPTSNVRLGRVLSYSAHPLPDLWRRGVNIGLNADDPGLFASDLSDEYGKVMQHCGFSFADLYQTVCQSLDVAFLPAEHKEALAQRLEQDWRNLC